MEDVLPCMRSNDPGLVLEEKFVTSPPPPALSSVGRTVPWGSSEGRGASPWSLPRSGAASPAQDLISERPWESCHFCRKAKPGSLNPKWGELKYPVH